jgi:hypothetical protein
MTPDELLADHTRAVRNLALRIRGFLLLAEPALTEKVYPGWHGLGYHHPDAGYVCAIFPMEDSVRFALEHGKGVSDPRGLMTFGSRSQVGYVELTPDDPIPETGIVELLQAAIDHGARRK